MILLLSLFVVEVLPKSFSVRNAEMVARLVVPPINFASTIVSPFFTVAEANPSLVWCPCAEGDGMVPVVDYGSLPPMPWTVH